MAVLAVVATVCAFTVHRALAPAELIAQLDPSSLPADGFSSAELRIESSNGRALHGVRIEPSDPHQLRVDSLSAHADSAAATLQAGVVAGVTTVHISADGLHARDVRLETTPDSGDSFGDGTPDFLRLHDPADRQAFRRWFTLLAEAQYYRGANSATEIDDCAALLRFAYREALREHDSAWARSMELPAPSGTGGVRQYQYPYTPLGAALFRVHDGSFAAADLGDGAFAEFADAETLWRRNTFRVGRDAGRAQPGDVFFFRQDGASHMPFHAMIFLGHSRIEPGDEQFVVYHTGPEGRDKGVIKRLSIEDLMNYPDARWRPVSSNATFLGVYRWNILRGGE
jgi:hypothetical protein